MLLNSIDVDNVSTIIDDCKNIGIILWVDDKGNLKYKGPKDLVTNKILATLKKSKEQIVEFLINSEAEKNNKDENSFPLTSIQRAYLTGRSLEYELGGISANYYFEIKCYKLDLDKFQYAFNEVIRNSDALRTIIFPTGYQKVLEHVPEYNIEIVHLNNKEEFMCTREKWSKHMYNLNKWPMFDIRLSKIKEEKTLHVSFDCMVLDAWSINMMLSKVLDVYEGKKVEWSNFTFEQYCEEERKFREEDINEQGNNYWNNRIKTLPKSPKLPFVQDLINIETPHFTRIHYKFTKEETTILYEKAKKFRVTPASVICTAYMKTLSKYSSNKDLTINMTVFNRLPFNKDVQKILGDFTNIGLAEYRNNSNTLSNEIKSVQKQFWDLVKYKNYNGLNIIKKICVDNPGRAVMPVVFTGVLQGLKKGQNYLNENMEQVYAISQTPQVVLDYQATDFTGELSVNWDYVVEAFDKDTIIGMFNDHINLLERIIYEVNWETVKN
jgi:yersiniabactin nonribosomal peptide synthetase